MNNRMYDFKMNLDQLMDQTRDEEGRYLWSGLFKVGLCLLAFGGRLCALPSLERLKNGPAEEMPDAYLESLFELSQAFPMLQAAFEQGDFILLPQQEAVLPEVMIRIFAASFDTEAWRELLLSAVLDAESQISEEMGITHARSSETKALAFRIFESWGPEARGERSLYDGASGTETFYWKPPENTRVYIQEEEGIWLALEAVRAFALGIPAERLVFEDSDALARPLLEGRRLRQYDWVYMEPKLGRSWSGVAKAVDFDAYGRFVYGKPPKKSAEWLYASQLIASLKPEGMGAMVMSAGALFSTATQKIRRKIIEEDIIETVIRLPKSVVYQTNSEAALVVFNRRKRRPGKILFVQADAFHSGPFSAEMPASQFYDIVAAFEVLYESDEDLESISRWVDNSSLKNDSLLPSKYVIGRLYISEGFGAIMMKPEVLEDQPDLPELGSLVDFYRGISPTGCVEALEGAYAIIQMADVQEGTLRTEEVGYYDITSRAKTAAYTVRAGDVILTARGRPKLALVPEEGDGMLISQSFIGMRPKAGVSGGYLKLYLESPLGGWLLSRAQQGSSVQSLNARDLKEIPVVLPDEARQRALVQGYEADRRAIEKKIEALEIEKKRIRVSAYEAMGIAGAFDLGEDWHKTEEERDREFAEEMAWDGGGENPPDREDFE